MLVNICKYMKHVLVLAINLYTLSGLTIAGYPHVISEIFFSY